MNMFSFPCSADHERDWPPCKVVFFGLATNTLNVRNNSSSNNSLATDSGYYVFFFITLYKNPYLGLVKILSGGWDNIFAGTSYSN